MFHPRINVLPDKVPPVTKVSLTSIVDKSKVYEFPSFLLKVAVAVPLSYVAPVVKTSPLLSDDKSTTICGSPLFRFIYNRC